jgi:hypothetical protein
MALGSAVLLLKAALKIFSLNKPASGPIIHYLLSLRLLPTEALKLRSLKLLLAAFEKVYSDENDC